MRLQGIWRKVLLGATIPTLALMAQSSGSLEGFAKGGDISMLTDLEKTIQYKEDGKPKDALQIMADHGCNWMRLRIFHTPPGVGGQIQDLPYTVALAKRIKSHGMKLLLDFHYSDGWADPGKQFIPADWKWMNHDQLVGAMYEYTRSVIATFREEGVLPEMVAVGNEITNGTLWDDGRVGGKFDTPAQWQKFGELIKAGIRGVHDGAGKGNRVLIQIHIDRGGDQPRTKWFFDNLLAQGVEFDVIGQSYYPGFHGTLEELKANLEFTAKTYNKDIVVAETAYSYRARTQPANAPANPRASYTPFPQTPEGQKQFFEELFRVIKATPNGHGKGSFHWAPERGTSGWFDENGNVMPVLDAYKD